jgi:hypothetical protein
VHNVEEGFEDLGSSVDLDRVLGDTVGLEEVSEVGTGR